jgi:hypothetical protein
MEQSESVVLTVVSGESEAEVVCGLLRSAGFVCGYRDTPGIDSSLEEFTSAGPREILVRAADVDAARALLEDSAP